jgi:hypothetical protein
MESHPILVGIAKTYHQADLSDIIRVTEGDNQVNYDLIAVVSTNHDVIEWAISKGVSCWDLIAANAVRYGYMDIFDIALANGVRINKEILISAAKAGYMPLLSAVRENSFNLWDSLGAAGAELARIDVVELAISRGINDVRNLANAAGLGGSLEILHLCESIAQPCHGKLKPRVPSMCIDWNEVGGLGARGNHMDIVLYAESKGLTWWLSVATQAARAGNLEIIKYALSKEPLKPNSSVWTSMASEAVLHNHTDVFDYILDRGQLRWRKILNDAIKMNNLYVFNIASTKESYSWNTVAIASASGGNISMFRIAIQNATEVGQPITWDMVADKASEAGSLEILKYCEDKPGIRWDNVGCNGSFIGRVDIVQLAINQGAIDYNTMAVPAAERGWNDIVISLLRLGASNIEGLLNIAKRREFYQMSSSIEQFASLKERNLI